MLVYDKAVLKNKYGLKPEQLIDFKVFRIYSNLFINIGQQIIVKEP